MRFRPRYKAWHGGECPVNLHADVQIILYRDTKLITATTPAFLLNWNSPDADRIVAYRVWREAP